MADIIDFPGKNDDGSWLYGTSEGSVLITPEKDRNLTLATSLFLLEACKISLLKAAGYLPYDFIKTDK